MATTSTIDWQLLFREMGRVRRAVVKHGIGGTFRLAAWSLSRMAYLREQHVWYRLDIQRDRVHLPLPRGLSLLKAREGQLDALASLQTISAREAQRRLDQGGELWLAELEGTTVFACWIFRRRTPALAARDGWVDLPPGTVGLDDSVVSESHRRRDLAPAVWSGVAAALSEQGVQAVVTKVAETDLPCRRAIERVGFRAVASMQLQRIGGRARVELQLHEDAGTAFLAAQLAR